MKQSKQVPALLVMNSTHPAMYLTITGIYLAFLTAVALILGRVRRRQYHERRPSTRTPATASNSTIKGTVFHLER